MYSADIINLCIKHYNENKNISTISYLLYVSKQTIYNWFYKYRYNFDNNIFIENINKSIQKQLNEDFVCEYVNSNIGCSLDNIAKTVNISKSTIYRILKRNNYSSKKIINKTIPYDIDKMINIRKEFSNNISDNEFLNCISIDESSFYINDYKLKGYSKKGDKTYKYYKHKQVRQKYKLLLAIDKNDIIDYKILNGAINLEIYKDFFIKNKDVFLNRTILHDNLRTHHAIDLKKYCKLNNINLLYTPAYSPEFNPIEETFSEIKRIFRKDDDHSNLILSINNSINNCNKENFIKYFNHSMNIIYKYR